MEVVNFEKFLYFNKCEVNILVNKVKRIEKLKLPFLFTLTNIYFFGDHPENKSKSPEDVELDKNLVCKLNHEQFFISFYDDQSKNITFSSRIEDVQIIMELRDYSPKDFKDFLNTCLIMDGYKIITEGMNMDYSSYLDYLLYLIENLILNSGSLNIDEDFFSVDLNFLSSLSYFFTRIERYVVKVNLYDPTFIQILMTIFYDDEGNRVNNTTTLEETPPTFPKLNLVKVLKFVENDLDDQGFEMLNKLFEQTEFLTELEISKNHISSKALQDLSKSISRGLRTLERLILSNNWVDSYMLDDFVKTSLESLPKLSFLDLSGNFIDNDFLKKFEMGYLRKVCNKYEFNEVLIDLSRNRFDTHLIRKNFYQWKPEDENERQERGIYTLDHFMQNVQTMKVKLKFKVDYIKHFKEMKDLEIAKKQLETHKCVKVFSRSVVGVNGDENAEIQEYLDLFEFFYLVDHFFDPNLNNFNNKDLNANVNLNSSFLNDSNRQSFYTVLSNMITQQLQVMNSFSFYVNVNHSQQLNNIQMVTANNHYSPIRNSIIKKLFHKNGETFNPNCVIEDLNDFFLKIKSSHFEIPLIAIHKFINRAKIETFLALKDKDIFSIRYLSEICTFFRLSFMEKIDIELSSLSEKSEIIHSGLKAVMNFEGHKLENNKYFFHEINNFLDFFIKEADSINLKNDLVYVAKYIQFLRNNKIRAKFYNIYENILKEENLFSSTDAIASEFDLIYKKYKEIEDFEKLRIPHEVKVKYLSLHPLKLDYLQVCEVALSDLEEDLKIVSSKLVEEESYGIRNIHDRIHFFLTQTSDEVIDPENKYKLHKQNNFLKITRLLFRYFNNLDIRSFQDNFYIDYIVHTDIKDKDNVVVTNTDRNAVVNFSKLKSMSDEDRRNNIERSAKEIVDYKKLILTFNSKPLTESLILSADDLKSEDEEQFNFLATQISEKLYEIFDKNFSEDGSSLLSLPQVCKHIKNFIAFFQDIKEQYQTNNPKFFDFFNIEVVMQVYRHMNRNEFSAELKIIQYLLGLLLILSFYLDLNHNITTNLKKWMNYMISKHYYTDYFKTILRNLVNYSNSKILWVPSIFEIESRLELHPIVLRLHFGKKHEEEYVITEKTTVSDLFEQIIRESKYVKDSLEKRMYWIYVKHLKINECVPVFNEEYVLDIISFLEENYQNNLDLLMEASKGQVKTATSANLDEDKQSENENGVPDGKKEPETEPLRHQSFIFTHIKLMVQRRVYSPFVIQSQFSSLHENEIFILFEQIKNHFIKQEFSIVVADGDTINLCAILIEILKRHSRHFDNNTSLEMNIDNNLHKVMPKFKKNIINNNHENFIDQVKKNIMDKNLAIRSEKDLEEEFLKILKNYEIFYSTVYEVKTKTVNSSLQIELPDKFLIMITLDYMLFIECNRFEPIMKFNYFDVIYCTYVGDCLYLAVLITDENGGQSEARLKLITDDGRLIMEDILSYSQIYLAINSNSNLTNCKINNHDQDLVLDFQLRHCDLKEFKLVYQRKLPFMKIISSSGIDYSAIQSSRYATNAVRNSILRSSPFYNKLNKISSTEGLKKNNSSQVSISRKEQSVSSLSSKQSNKIIEHGNDKDTKEINVEGIMKKQTGERGKEKRVSFKDDQIVNTIRQIKEVEDKKENVIDNDTSDIKESEGSEKVDKIIIPTPEGDKFTLDSVDSLPKLNSIATDSEKQLPKAVDATNSYASLPLNSPATRLESVAMERTKNRISEAMSMMPFKSLFLKNNSKGDLLDPTNK